MISTNTSLHATEAQRIEADCKRLGPYCPKTIALYLTLDNSRITIFLSDEGLDRVAELVQAAVWAFRQSEEVSAKEEMMAHAVAGCEGCTIETARSAVQERGLDGFINRLDIMRAYDSLCRAFNQDGVIPVTPAMVLASKESPSL